MHRHRTLPFAIVVFATLASAATAQAYPYCGATQACGVPPREQCDTLCYECTGPDAGTEYDGGLAGSCDNPTLIRVRDMCCPCIESNGCVNSHPCEQEQNPCQQAATGLFSDQKPEAQLCSPASKALPMAPLQWPRASETGSSQKSSAR